MRCSLGFDPRHHDYGPATAAIRSILVAWSEIDWFEAPRAGEAEARRLIYDHNALGRAHAPELFADHVDIEVVSGDWERFGALCASVRVSTVWDWKRSILRQLSSRHARAYGWRLEEQRVAFALGGLEALPARPAGESARFYYRHANGDLFDCLEWQLAEGHAELAGNAFYPLVRCYRAGFYPFSLGPSTVALFQFATAPRELPRAILLPKRGRGRAR